MDGRTTLVILFCMSFGLWMVGFQSGAVVLYNNWFGGAGVKTFTDAQTMLTVMITAVVGIGAASIIFGSLTSNFGQIYTIPAVIVSTVVLPFFLVPFSFIAEPSLPLPIKILLTGIFSILILLSMLGFIRGGEL